MPSPPSCTANNKGDKEPTGTKSPTSTLDDDQLKPAQAEQFDNALKKAERSVSRKPTSLAEQTAQNLLAAIPLAKRLWWTAAAWGKGTQGKSLST